MVTGEVAAARESRTRSGTTAASAPSAARPVATRLPPPPQDCVNASAPYPPRRRVHLPIATRSDADTGASATTEERERGKEEMRDEGRGARGRKGKGGKGKRGGEEKGKGGPAYIAPLAPALKAHALEASARAVHNTQHTLTIPSAHPRAGNHEALHISLPAQRCTFRSSGTAPTSPRFRARNRRLSALGRSPLATRRRRSRYPSRLPAFTPRPHHKRRERRRCTDAHPPRAPHPRRIPRRRRPRCPPPRPTRAWGHTSPARGALPPPRAPSPRCTPARRTTPTSSPPPDRAASWTDRRGTRIPKTETARCIACEHGARERPDLQEAAADMCAGTHGHGGEEGRKGGKRWKRGREERKGHKRRKGRGGREGSEGSERKEGGKECRKRNEGNDSAWCIAALREGRAEDGQGGTRSTSQRTQGPKRREKPACAGPREWQWDVRTGGGVVQAVSWHGRALGIQ
ncbi:hypothetical protein DFH09DRAFT_1289479 [Mycena vulgaris]|nr:hypothetical protein DFH09DRAFT_1289479 [Mycena vulgaris]